ncbi:MAG: hypothetical protein HN578_21870 [Rhodospirillales bacterium]|nr:hypothetical protein [Rhodospirillales bacterium]MBT3907212.1 hypothetical protein [Rhodospirillaceae bacterium]MBT5036168.1 hypothetical protein [Rhodospirillaceae bacterium]MBT6218627.1 hypothetical protein [Rhodospirillaceae bacterium]MBT6364089.1 hypothetical protein [Rhodospirillaceae bacterium]
MTDYRTFKVTLKNVFAASLVAIFIFTGPTCSTSFALEIDDLDDDKPEVKPEAELKKIPKKLVPALPMPSLKGPKRTVAVGKFSTIGSFSQKYGNWDIGGGLAAMLTTELLKSDRFVVLERAHLSKVLSEQEMKAGGIVKPGTGPKLGQLAGVQLLIYGAVTEFSTDDSGGGLSLGVSGIGGLPFSLGGAQESNSGKVAMDIRVVDTTTGEVLESHTVSHKVSDSAFNISGGYSGISLGGNKFKKTPLGEATRGTIQKAVLAIIGTAARKPWTGLVVGVDGRDIVINAGLRSGLKKGDMFMIERVGKVFTDPSTGEVLGVNRKELGVLRLSNVKDKLSFGGYMPLSNDFPKRGDTIVIMKN